MDPTTLHNAITKLSPRQMQIARLLCEGKTGKEVSAILSISTRAVKEHVRKMCYKTGAQNRVQLIVMLVKWEMLRDFDRENL